MKPPVHRERLNAATSQLLGILEPGWLAVSACKITGVSQVELNRDGPGRYLAMFERFVRAVVLGLQGTVALDLVANSSGLSVCLLVGCQEGNEGIARWSPDAQLERLSLQVARAFAMEPTDPTAHLESVREFAIGVTLEPASVEIGHGAIAASAVLPLEVSPSGMGTLAQVLEVESSQSPCAVRFLIAPVIGARPSTELLLDQLANANRLANDVDAPRVVSYRAKAIRTAIQKMIDLWLGQACTVEIQVRSNTPNDARGVVQLIRDEIARPKAAEVQEIRGGRSFFMLREIDSDIPILSASPTVRQVAIEQLSPAPIPSFWASGTGERPKHLTGVGIASLLAMPPLPEYCDLSSIRVVVVEAKAAIRPALWLGDHPVGTDAIGNRICFDEEALARHVHLIGVPGSGKTTLMRHMIRGDIHAGRGFVVFDPHSDLARRISTEQGWTGLGITGNTDFPGLRILESASRDFTAVERDVGAIIEAVESALPKDFTGPRFRQLARACLTMHSYVGVGQQVADSLKYIQNELTFDQVRIDYSGPDWVTQFFDNYYRQRDTEQAELQDWFASKFTDYLRTQPAQRLFAPVGEGLTAQEVVNSNSQLVVDFSAMGASTYDAGLLGQLFVTSFLRNILAGGPRLDRKFMLYLDEVQLFFGPAVERALQEGRKYGLCVVAAHQTSSQLSRERFDSLVGQVGLELVFRCSLRDSELLAERLDLSLESVAALPDLSCWLSGGIAVQRGGTFLMRTTWSE